MDLATLGALLVGVAGVAGTVVTWVGKRGENQLNRWNSVVDQVQEERDGFRIEAKAQDARIAELLERRLADQVELARLRVKIIELGGDLS